jgi:hypothetical protein
MELASSNTSDAYNFVVAPRILGNLYTPGWQRNVRKKLGTMTSLRNMQAYTLLEGI